MSAAFLPCTPLSTRTFTPAPRAVTRHAPRIQVAKMSLKDDILQRAKADTQLLAKNAGKILSVIAITAALSMPLNDAMAASGGGRIGGSSFRRPPSVQRVAPRAPSGGGGGYGYGYGGYSPFMPSMYMSPFFLPFGGFGFGGGFGSLLLFGTAAAFLYQSVQNRVVESEFEEATDPVTCVSVLKIGLLSTARSLQLDLDMLARSADTASVSGLQYVLQETSMALLRNPDYWTHASIDVKQARLSKAENEFNSVCVEERLKLDEETLSNTGGRRSEMQRASAAASDLSKAPSEYIVVTVIVASSGELITKLPKSIDGAADVQRALRAVAGVATDSLQGVEVIWAPQSLKDSVTEQELLADHPELRLL